MTIAELCKAAHDAAVANGFYDIDTTIEHRIALVHSELSEAVEEVRRGNVGIFWKTDEHPFGFSVELADAMIRIADLAGALGIDLESCIKAKMAYNLTREYRHGKVGI